MVEDSALGLSTYIVERAFDKSMVSLTLNFKDEGGNTVLSTAAKFIVTRETIETPDGRVLGCVTHKVLSLMPTYELHDGDSSAPVNGTIKEQFTLASLAGKNTIKILGSDGQPIATATGQLFNFNFSITDNEGANIATVSRTFGGKPNGGLMDTISAGMKDQYTMRIEQQGKVPTIMLLEFLVVLEIIIHKNNSNRGGVYAAGGAGLGAGFGGGFRGGSFRVGKL